MNYKGWVLLPSNKKYQVKGVTNVTQAALPKRQERRQARITHSRGWAELR
jgi:hypothetical protein